MSEVVEYEGLGEHAGWRFTLEPARSPENGSPGYIRRQIAPATHNVESLSSSGHLWNKRHSPEFAARCEKRILDPEPMWPEAEWLVQWLKHRAIRRVTPTTDTAGEERASGAAGRGSGDGCSSVAGVCS